MTVYVMRSASFIVTLHIFLLSTVTPLSADKQQVPAKSMFTPPTKTWSTTVSPGCAVDKHRCEYGSPTCIPDWEVCDGEADCASKDDEVDCDLKFKLIDVGTYSANTSVDLYWDRFAVAKDIQFQIHACFVSTVHHICLEQSANTSFGKRTFTNLQPFTVYSVNASIIYKKRQGPSFYPFPSFQTAEGRASQPTHVRVESNYGFKVSWQAPKTPAGIIRRYKVHYLLKEKEPADEEIRYVIPSATKKVETTLLLNLALMKTYKIWVTAFTVMDGQPSEIKEVIYTTRAAVDCVDGTTAKLVNTTKVQLSWKPFSGFKVEQYLVHYESVTQHEVKVEMPSTATSYIVPILAPGTLYTFTVEGFHTNGSVYSCNVAQILTNGKALQPPVLRVDEIVPHLLEVSWTTSLPSTDQQEYTLYYSKYGTTVAEQRVSTATSLKLQLEQCTSYHFAVRLSGPEVCGPFSNIVYEKTSPDIAAPPKDISVYIKENQLHVCLEMACQIKWTSSDVKVGYLLSVTEVLVKKTVNYVIPPTYYEFSRCHHLIPRDLHCGATYLIKVKKDLPNGTWSHLQQFNSSVCPAPDLSYWIDLYGSYHLKWKVDSVQSPHVQEFYLMRVLGNKNNSWEIVRVLSDRQVHLSAADIIVDRVNTFAVKYRTEYGYMSDPSFPMYIFPVYGIDKDTSSLCKGSFACETHWQEAKCLPFSQVCDGSNDCGDWSDEKGCVIEAPAATITSTVSPGCPADKHRCEYGSPRCIPLSLVCDGEPDCASKDDELDCGKPSRCIKSYACKNLPFICLPFSKVCDGNNDCGDRSDERDCVTGTTTADPAVIPLSGIEVTVEPNVVKEGWRSTANFRCFANGSDFHSYKWSKSGGRLPTRFKTLNWNWIGYATLDRVRSSDAGIYTCTADNAARQPIKGQVLLYVDINVEKWIIPLNAKERTAPMPRHDDVSTRLQVAPAVIFISVLKFTIIGSVLLFAVIATFLFVIYIRLRRRDAKKIKDHLLKKRVAEQEVATIAATVDINYCKDKVRLADTVFPISTV